MKLTHNRMIAGLLVAVGVVASVVFATSSNAAIYSGPDCSTNAIIHCGVSSPSDLRNKYNASAELKALYGHFGVTSAVMNSTMHSGVVTNSGDVIVDGKTVATHAMSVGRHEDDGSGCKGTPFHVTVSGQTKTFYEGTTSCRFGTNPNYTGQAAYVMLTSDGQFAGAILIACGNIIPATPVPPKPKPVAVCDTLTATAIVSNMVGAPKLDFNYTTKAVASGGATIKSYSYNFGDGTTKTAGATTSHAYKEAGTYKTTVTVTFSVNGTSTTSSCATYVTATKTTPKPPVVTCDALKLNKISRNTFSLDATASATPGVVYVQQPGSISGYTFTVKDSKGNVVKTINVKAGVPMQSANSGNFTLLAGTYTANVVVHSNAGDKGGNGSCAVAFTVQPTPGEACNTETHKIEKIADKTKENTPPYTTETSQCQPIKVCDTTATPPVIRDIYPNQMREGYLPADSPECQPKTPMCTVPGKENLPANSTDCVEQSTPPVSTVLPTTGISDVFSSIIGLGSITGAAWYYFTSRRS